MRAVFAFGAILLDVAAIVIAAMLSALAYHVVIYDPASTRLPQAICLGAFVAVVYVTQKLLDKECGCYRFLKEERNLDSVLARWTLAFLSGPALEYFTKTNIDVSRGTTAMFLFVGGAAVMASQGLTARTARSIAVSSPLLSRRVFLVGFEQDIEAYLARHPPWRLGLHIVNASVLRADETLRDDLKLAVASARVLKPDDVFILAPWSKTGAIRACADAFQCIPCAIYLGPDPLLDRFSEAHVQKYGGASTLRLVRRPLTRLDVWAKRTFDLTLALLALVALAPLFALVAIAIKLDSPGPVFFLQRRYGFNREPFRIVKFRSMTTLEDHHGLRQATRADPRVTRVGRFIRRSNIDELPQLLNVILGHMSLVGPRPHALAHDQQFGEKIAEAARRHNVKPGITGWAQVHGYRGEINSDATLRGRIEHDLYYVDNWSLWLDLRILALTVFSPQVYTNAY